MGDSDEEHDRRRRDKFRGERNDYDNTRRPAPSRYDRGRNDRINAAGGGAGNSGGAWERPGKRDYYSLKDQGRGSDRRDGYGRGSSPPSKRSKRDWEGNGGHWQGSHDSNALVPQDKSSTGVPVLMSFKDFIIQQEDDVDEVDAVKRYQEYKIEFKRTQINDFFVLHKDEEWFEEKYHPHKSIERQTIIRKAMRKRLRKFLDLWEEGYLNNLHLQLSENGAVLKFLDQVVTRLEGGSEEDFKALDLPPPSPPQKKSEDEKEEKKEPPKEEEKEKEPLPPGMEEDDEPLPPGMEDDDIKKEEEADEDAGEKAKNANNAEQTSEQLKSEEKIPYDGSRMKHALSVFMRQLPPNIKRSDVINVCKRYPGFLRVAMSEPSPERRYSRRCWVTFEHDVNIKDINWSMSNLRIKDMELIPVVNRDVTNRVRPVNGIVCSPVAMQLDVKYVLNLIKKLDEKSKIYERFEPNNDKVKSEEKEDDKSDGESKDDEKSTDGISDVEKVVEEKESEETEEEILDIPEANPLLEQFPSHIEEIVTGVESENGDEDGKEYPLVVNEELSKYLDLGILYLRVIHCIDYYNGNEYAHEDEMPMRCGIIHVRGPQLEAASKKDVHEWHKANIAKLSHLLADDEVASKEEAAKLGEKDEETEVENFIKANTQELAKDKWLCPLSGKKFRGPEFVRKHIMMKHSGDIDNVKTEVQFFNNYVHDTKRPMFPEVRRATASNHTPSHGAPTQGWSSNANRQMPYNTPRAVYQSSYNPSTPQSAPLPDTYGRVNTFPPKGIKRSGGGGNYRDRRLIKYRDLDAPEESDFF